MFSRVHGHMVVTDGLVDVNESDVTRSSITARLDPATINTGVPVRDDHLRSPDFFDVKNHPEILFKSTAISITTPAHYAVIGRLSIHGVSQLVTLHVRVGGQGPDRFGNTRAGASARASLNRKDFGLRWNQALETGGLLLGDEVDIILEIQAVREQAKQKAA
ncbi:MAG TPA: YceI family protein [Candidatus Dormibacteraeota bacterium]|nr:YceI family protein [Candidatus Dormibacteraeota bacterium]